MSEPSHGEDGEGGPHISIAVGVVVALLASFVQSLGLTIQRKSHIHNERQPASSRRRDWQRPLWLIGFAIFVTSNVLGSVFQIGALPIVVLAPLGAVSLLWNAFFARILLGDIFSRYLVIGTVLIAGGAVLIAIFGVVPDVTHTLEELIALYTRSSFIVWILIQFALIIGILGLAHYSESRLERRLQDIYIALPDSDEGIDGDDLESGARSALTPVSNRRNRKARRWSTPPAYLGGHTDTIPNATEGPPPPSPGAKVHLSPIRTIDVHNTTSPPSRHVSFGVNTYRSPASTFRSDSADGNAQGRTKNSESKYKPSASQDSSIRPRLPHDKVEQMRLWLGIAYGSASGTLSGLCLLFAKTGVELLILTVVGQNQFKRWESWMIVLALLVCALLQLWYLNKSLRLVGPTLICPLAFCFYNLSSIFNGLMYYDQWSQLTGLQDGLMCLGIATLLAGVWIVSIKASDGDTEDMDLVLTADVSEVGAAGERDRLLADSDEPGGRGARQSMSSEVAEEGHYVGIEYADAEGESREETYGDLKSRIAQLYQAFLLDQAGPTRGFSVGIAASSPGFAIRPQAGHHQRRNTTATLPALQRFQAARHSHSRSDDLSVASNLVVSPTDESFADDSAPQDTPNRPIHLNRTASDGAAAHAVTSSTMRDREVLNYRHRRKRSLAGDVYVGAPDPFSEEPAIEVPPSPKYGHTHGLTRSSSIGSGHSGPRRQYTQTAPTSPLDQVESAQVSSDGSGIAGHINRFLPWSSTSSKPRVNTD